MKFSVPPTRLIVALSAIRLPLFAPLELVIVKVLSTVMLGEARLPSLPLSVSVPLLTVVPPA